MKLIISKINEKIFDGEFKSVLVPAGRGEMEILPEHAPLVSFLREGKIIYEDKGGNRKEIEINRGFLEINKKEVLIII